MNALLLAEIESDTLIREPLKQGDIRERAYSDLPYLLGQHGLIIRKNDKVVEVRVDSLVTPEVCRGHFGSKEHGGVENPRVALFHLCRCIMHPATVAAHEIFPGFIAVPVSTGVLKALGKDLYKPPASVHAYAKNFRIEGNTFTFDGYAEITGEPYAEMLDVQFKMIPRDKFCPHDVAPEEPQLPSLYPGWQLIGRRLYPGDVEELLLERPPFQRVVHVDFFEDEDGGIRVVAVSTIRHKDCAGQLELVQGHPIGTGVDYSRIGALTGELVVAKTLMRKGRDVVPLAVKVDSISTPSVQLLTPPFEVVSEAVIPAESMERQRRLIKRFLQVDSVDCWVAGENVLHMENVLYNLVPEKKFIAGD